MEIIALVPAYNETTRIGATLAALLKIHDLTKIVVINDGSTDDTAAVIRKFPVEIIDLPVNRGKGQALNRGWQKYEADIYLLIDADLEASAYLGGQLLPPVINGESDMTIACFSSDQTSNPDQKMGFGIAKRFASWGIERLTGRKIASPLSGQRAIRREILVATDGFAPQFGVEVALTIGALKNGFKVTEVDLSMTHRATGRGLAGFKHRGKQLWNIIKVLVVAWRKNR